jgi:addiction module HigA family antidote
MIREEQMSPVHPGEILLEDFMKPLGISQYRLAKAMGVYPRKINEIVQGSRTGSCALRWRDTGDRCALAGVSPVLDRRLRP